MLTERRCQRSAQAGYHWCLCTTNHLHQGTLHEASLSKPDINFAKAFIDTHAVQDNQRVEHAHEVGATRRHAHDV